MTCDPHASLHLGLSAEAMVLIDPQLGNPRSSGETGKNLWLSAIVSIVLLMLIAGAPVVRESDFRQLAKALDCTSRCTEPAVIAARKSILSH